MSTERPTSNEQRQSNTATKPTLEDYIFEMETRPPESAAATAVVTDQSLWEQLRKKDEDLLLAAELGKALLEKNEEMTKQHERTIEEYSTKLEVSAYKQQIWNPIICTGCGNITNFFF